MICRECHVIIDYFNYVHIRMKNVQILTFFYIERVVFINIYFVELFIKLVNFPAVLATIKSGSVQADCN